MAMAAPQVLKTGLSVAGIGLQAAGSLQQGNAEGDMADYNASIADQNASTVVSQGAEESRRSLVNSRKMIGSATAAYGASGITGEGSVEDVLRSSAAQGELNSLTIKNAAAIKATAYGNEAALDRYRAANSRLAGRMGAASALIKGAGSLIPSPGSSSGGGDSGGGAAAGAGAAEGAAG